MDSENFAIERQVMVREQLMAPGRCIADKRVLRAMREAPRHRFVPLEMLHASYEDRPLPIRGGQTISQPYIVAAMTELLALQPGDRVLEIGTGSGYQTAVLSRLAGEVFSIEIIPELSAEAQEVFGLLGYANIHCRLGDGYDGWPEEAPFDAIIVTCAPEAVPQPLIDQLRVGGRLVIPLGEAGAAQDLMLFTKEEGRLVPRRTLAVRFVPMTGKAVG